VGIGLTGEDVWIIAPERNADLDGKMRSACSVGDVILRLFR